MTFVFAERRARIRCQQGQLWHQSGMVELRMAVYEFAAGSEFVAGSEFFAGRACSNSPTVRLYLMQAYVEFAHVGQRTDGRCEHAGTRVQQRSYNVSHDDRACIRDSGISRSFDKLGKSRRIAVGESAMRKFGGGG